MPDKTTYKALSNGTLVAHVPLTFARTPSGGRLFAREDGRNRDRNKELATVQTVALGALRLVGGLRSSRVRYQYNFALSHRWFVLKQFQPIFSDFINSPVDFPRQKCYILFYVSLG